MRAIMVAVVVFLATTAAVGRPPPNSDPNTPIAKWFARQYNMRGGSCCGEADGHRLNDNQWRIAGNHYQVQIDNVWYPIEDWQLRRDVNDANPTGQAIVWYNYDRSKYNGTQIYCFTPGWQS
jgi:hypothetical protein